MTKIEIILLLIYGVNIIMSVLFALIIRARKSLLPASMFVVMLLVPVFGTAAYYIVARMYSKGSVGKRGVDTDRFDITNDAFKQIEVSEDTDVVPLQDALIMNEASTRRKMMMEILHKDPTKFTDLLKKVVLYDDTEMTHYSVTTIMEINSLYETELNKLNSECRENPQNVDILGNYAMFIKRYIDSGLLEGTRLAEMRIRYTNVLLDCIKAEPQEIKWRLYCIENENAQKHFTQSRKLINEIPQNWRGDERVWLRMLETAIAQRDGDGIKRLCAEAHAYRNEWSQETKNRFAFFMEDGEI